MIVAALTIMKDRMLASSHMPKVDNAIVKTVAVDMMDNLIIRKRTTKVLFHYVAMLKNLSAANTNVSIASLGYPASCVLGPPAMETAHTAKVAFFSDKRGVFLEVFAAIKTYQWNLGNAAQFSTAFSRTSVCRGPFSIDGCKQFATHGAFNLIKSFAARRRAKAFFDRGWFNAEFVTAALTMINDWRGQLVLSDLGCTALASSSLVNYGGTTVNARFI